MRRFVRSNAITSGLLLACASCAVESNDSVTEQPGVTAPVELQDIVDRVRLSYTTVDGERFMGQQPTYQVAATNGRVAVTPRTWVQYAPTPVSETQPSEEVLEGTAITFETVGIARGEAFDLGAGETTVGPDGSLRIDRDVAEERLINDPQGVEQQWHFNVPPAGSGDLVVRVAVSGQVYGGQDERGHHFTDEANGIGVKYGLATWVDAHSINTEVPVTFEDGHLVITVPDTVVARSAFPAILDPTIQSEVQLISPGIGPSAYEERKPAIAHNNIAAEYFIVWADQRNGLNFDIYGARVRASDGVVLNTTGIPITTQPYDQVDPDVTFDGTNYLVVWSDRRSNTNWDIYGQRIAGDGSLNGAEIAIDTSAGDQIRPALSNNGASRWAVVWQDNNGTSTIFYTRITPAGIVEGPNAALDDGQGTAQTYPDVSCDGTFCLTVWEQAEATLYRENIRASRIRAVNGVVEDNPSFVVSGAGLRQLRPKASNAGSNTTWTVIWVDGRNGTNFDIYQNRINVLTASVAYGPGFDGIVLNNNSAYQFDADIGFYDGQYMVSWADARVGGTATPSIFAARLQPNSTVTDVAGFSVNTVAGGHAKPAVAGGSMFFMVVWEDLRRGRNDITHTRISPAGIVQDFGGKVTSTAGSRQLGSSTVFDGTYYFTVFSDSRTGGHGNYDLKAVRINGQGTSLDPAGRNISLAAGRQLAPDMVWDGTQFMVVWSDDRDGNFDIYGQIVDSNYVNSGGEFLISGGAANADFPAIAWNGTEYLVVWEDTRSGNRDIYGQRVTTAGALNGGEILISNAADNQRRPDVASDGTNWQVVWQDRRSGVDNGEDIWGSQVTGAGMVAGDVQISSAAGKQEHARVDWDGTNYMSIWDDARNGATNRDIHGCRLDTAGNPVDSVAVGLPFATAANDASRPDLELHNGTWFIAWRRRVIGASDAIDLRGSRFTLAGAPIACTGCFGPATNEFWISNQPGNEDQPSLADFGNGVAAMAVYQRFDEASSTRSERMFARAIFFP